MTIRLDCEAQNGEHPTWAQLAARFLRGFDADHQPSAARSQAQKATVFPCGTAVMKKPRSVRSGALCFNRSGCDQK
jgi:hypothetical protein